MSSKKCRRRRSQVAQKYKALFSTEVGPLNGKIHAQREKIQENRQIMQSEITQLKETISVMRKQLQTPDGK